MSAGLSNPVATCLIAAREIVELNISRALVFITTVTVIYSLQHRLYTLTQYRYRSSLHHPVGWLNEYHLWG